MKFLSALPFVFLFTLLTGASWGASEPARPPKGFEPNRGQSVAGAQFITRQGPLIVRATGSSLDFAPESGAILSLRLVGCRGRWEGESPTGEVVRYEIGADARLWTGDVQKFAKLRMRNALPGVDWVVYWRDGKIEYDLFLDSASRLSSIEMEWSGYPVEFSGMGGVDASIGKVRWSQQAPGIFQGGNEIGGKLRRSGVNRARFAVGEGVGAGPVRIDPAIELAGVFGSAEDEQVVLVTPEYVLGTTRSQAWEGGGQRSGSDVFLRVYLGGNGYRTYFWGGSGDEELTPVKGTGKGAGPTAVVVYAAGWTNSRDLPIRGVSGGVGWKYGGGDSDGLIVSATTAGIVGTTLSTANSEKLYSVISTGTFGYYYAGETRAPGSTDTQAVVGRRSELGDAVWTGGGAGSDRIRSILVSSASLAQVLFAGETDSDDIGGKQTRWSARGGARDAWVGALDFGELEPTLRWQGYFGGPADEDVAGLILLPGRGLYIGGTTNSDNLRLVLPAQGQYGGGASDGYLVRFSADGQNLVASTYWGGSGADQVYHLSSLVGDLVLSGSSDSSDLALGGGAGLAPAIDTDAVAAVFDTRGKPYWGIRAGGPGIDRFTYAGQPTDTSPFYLGGVTSSRDWAGELRPRLLLESSGPGGGLDAFLLRVRTPLISSGDVVVGNNLQAPVTLQYLLDSTYTGTIEVSSADPSIALIGYPNQNSGVAAAALFLYSAGRPEQFGFTPNITFTVHSAGREGSTEVILRAANVPERRIAVRVVRSALYVPSEVVGLAVGEIRTFLATICPVDPLTGRPLGAQSPRAGLNPQVEFTASDPSALISVPPSNYTGPLGQNFEVRKEGKFELTPRSPSFATGEGQAIRVDAARQGVSGQTARRAKLYVWSGFSWLGYVPSGTGMVTVTSDDPNLVTVSETTGSSGRAAVTIDPSKQNSFVGQTKGKSGRTILRMRSTGGFEDTIELILLAGDVQLNAPASATLDKPTSASVGILRNLPADVPDSEGYVPATLSESPFSPLANGSLACENGGQTEGLFTYVNLKFTKLGTWQCRLEYRSAYFSHPTQTASVDVRPATLRWDGPELLIPEGMAGYIFLSPDLPPGLDTLQFHFTKPAVAQVEIFEGSPLTAIPLTILNSSVLLRALGNAGSTTAIHFDDGILGGLEIPVRVVRATLDASYAPQRLSRPSADISIDIRGVDDGRMLPRLMPLQGSVTLSIRSSNPEVCDVTTPEITTQSSLFGLPLRCGTSGETVLTLTQRSGRPALDPFQIKIQLGVNPADIENTAPAVSLSPGFQTAWSQIPAGLRPPFRLRSGNPDLLRLSADSGRPGTGELVVTSNGPNLNPIFLQAGPGTGTTKISIDSDNAPTVEVAVRITKPSFVFANSNYPNAVLPEVKVAVGEDLIRFTAYAMPIDPDSGQTAYPIPAGLNNFLVTPEAEPLLLRASSTNPGSVAVPGPSTLVSSGLSDLKVEARVGAVGEATLELSQPPGFQFTAASRMRVSVEQPPLTISGVVYLGAGLQQPITIRAGNGKPIPAGTTITSLNPEALVISASNRTLGQARMSLSANPYVYLQATTRDATLTRASFRLEAPGLPPKDFEVVLEPVTVSWGGNLNAPWTYSESSQTLNFNFGLTTSYARQNSSGLSFAPGRKVDLQVSVGSEGVLALPDGNQAKGFEDQLSYTIRVNTLKPGQTTVEATVGEGAVSELTPRTITVAARTFSLPPELKVGRGLVAMVELNFYNYVEAFIIRFRTPDGSGYTIGPSAATATAQELSLAIPADRRLQIFVAGSATAGASSLLVDGPFFLPATIVLTAATAQFNVNANNIPNPIALARGNLDIPVYLTGCEGCSTQALAASAGPLTLRLSTSDPKVAQFTSDTLIWQAGESQKAAAIRLNGVGTTVLTIETPAFGSTAKQKLEYLINVR